MQRLTGNRVERYAKSEDKSSYLSYYNLRMQTLQNSDAFDWISKGRTPTPHSRDVNAVQGVNLSCLFPLKFERYVKILHRIDAHYENIDIQLSSEELNILQIPNCNTIKALVLKKRLASNSTRVLWREAAEALEVSYAPAINHSWFSRTLQPHPECWPRFLWGPGEGALEKEECCELASILAQVIGEQECYFRLAEVPFVGTDQEILFFGRLNEVEEYFVRGGFQFTPEYWWSADRAWCVCSDYDLDFTIVGGNSCLAELLLESKILECMEVNADIRIDYLTPIPAVGFSSSNAQSSSCD